LLGCRPTAQVDETPPVQGILFPVSESLPLDRRQLLTLYLHELRCALRERNIVIYSIVLPLVMYPGILWAGIAGITFVQGQANRLPSRVAVVDLPAVHSQLADSLSENADIRYSVLEDDREDAITRIGVGRLDALVEFTEPVDDGAGLPDNFGVLISYNEARGQSDRARTRVEAAVARYRRDWVDRERRALGVEDAAWADFAIISEDGASNEDIARFILGLLVPMLMLVMVAMASFYPAIDATAGERERSTWETLMTVAAPRSTVAAAKYLYVATFGMMGGLLNLLALTLSLQWILRPLGGEAAEALATGGVPLSALPVIAIGTLLLGLFIAAGMLVFAAFAQNFKEGQSMIMPFYLLLVMPAVFLQSPDMEFTMTLAVIPVANTIMVIRETITGSFPLAQIAVSLGTMTVCVVVAISFAQWVMSNEEVLMGSQEGGLSSFLKRRLKSRKERA
jgi:sodium transport system permease protein